MLTRSIAALACAGWCACHAAAPPQAPAPAARSDRAARWATKLAAIRAQVEADPALTSRRKPSATRWAMYIARMHRRVHERWAFGVLARLDREPASHPHNAPGLYTILELSIDPSGALHEVTVARTSGHREFDAAAVDAMTRAAPFAATPEVIRGADGRARLRWGLYRDDRQCATFNVEPYLAPDPPAASPPRGAP